jgi:hypothetical protein
MKWYQDTTRFTTPQRIIPKWHDRVRRIDTKEQPRHIRIRQRRNAHTITSNDDVIRQISAYAANRNFNNASQQIRSATRRMNEYIPFGSVNAPKEIQGIMEANLGRYVISEFDTVVQNYFSRLCEQVRTLKINFRFKTGKHTLKMLNGQSPEITQEDEEEFTNVILDALGVLWSAPHLGSLNLDFHSDENKRTDYRLIPRVGVGTQTLGALSNLGNVRSLHTLVINLRSNDIDAHGAKILAGLNKSQTLETLSIRLDENPMIGAVGMSALADLNQSPSLKTLRLQFSLDEIDDVGISNMCNILKFSPNLGVLQLSFVNSPGRDQKVFSYDGIVALVSLKDAPMLHTLRLQIEGSISLPGRVVLLNLCKNATKSNGSKIKLELSFP